MELGEPVEATAACQRARELDPTNMWGPLATAWIDRAQGDTAGAMRWIDEARKLEPKDIWLADQKIELLLAQGKPDEAFAVMRELPSDGNFFSLAREASLVYSDKGPAALKAFVHHHEMRDRAGTGAELAELARLQVFAGDAAAAKTTLTHAQRILPSSTADLYDGSQIRHEYSSALIHARIELGGGDRERAMKLLTQVERLLDTYEKEGGQHFGLYSLRSELHALRGDKTQAAAALVAAWNHGWRNTWRARHDPYLASVPVPGTR
jgi:tetratricopeptide (TPR) repeat protein